MWRCNSKNTGNGEPLIFRRNLIQEVWIEEVEQMENDYIEYKKDPSAFKVRSFEIETTINELKEKIHEEEERLGIKVKL